MNAMNVCDVFRGFVSRTVGLDELPFLERWRTVWYGLKKPADSGEYKFARLQILRLSAVGAAILTPCLAVLLLILFALLGLKPDLASVFTVNLPKEYPKAEPDLVKSNDEPFDLNPDATADVPPEAMGLGLTQVITDFGAPVQQNNAPVAIAGIVATRKPMPNVRPDVPIGDRPGISLVIGKPNGARDGTGKYGPPRKENEDAIFRALRWLKANQASDGSWPIVKPAMTSLALLAFLGHGELPDSEEFGDTVQRAMEWMLNNQEADGRFKGRDPHDYSQPIAAYALCESAMLTGIPTVRYAAERAMEVVLAGQHADGAWDYNCKKTDRKDTSYMGWCIQALKAATIAKVGDPQKLEAASKAAVAAMRRQFCEGAEGSYGGFGYTGPGNGAGGLTGAGVLCLELLHAGDTAEARGGLRTVEQWKVDWKNPNAASPLYYWYYAVQAAFHAGGSPWERWDKMFSTALVRNQTIQPGGEKGRQLGYWDSPAASEHHDGRVMDTSLCVLMLEVYYRYLPSYTKLAPEPAKVAARPAAGSDLSIDVKGM